MFTGIVEGAARVEDVVDRGGLRRLVLHLPEGKDDRLTVGGSIAVAGTCLTVVAFQGRTVAFDCIGETLARTTLGALRPGARVNVERAARVGDEIGGHVVSGHVTTTLPVVARTEHEGNLTLAFAFDDPSLARYVLPKGFVAIDGCSLTVSAAVTDRFEVYLIPETRRVTTLDALRVGDRVNLELDPQTVAIVDTVERVLAARLPPS